MVGGSLGSVSPQAVLLVGIAFCVGVLLTSVGPSGVFTTVALYALTDHTPQTVAGTASASFIPIGLAGTAVYLRSGELTTTRGRRIALIISATGLLGARAGAELNTMLPVRLFELLLGLVVVGIALVLLYREYQGLAAATDVVSPSSLAGIVVYGLLGGGIGILGGLLGLGGPLFAVPVLVLFGLPMLAAVAIAQVQLIFIAGFATAGYLAHDAVSLPLLVLVGAPQLVGVVSGWVVAHRIDSKLLRLGLAVAAFLMA